MSITQRRISCFPRLRSRLHAAESFDLLSFYAFRHFHVVHQRQPLLHALSGLLSARRVRRVENIVEAKQFEISTVDHIHISIGRVLVPGLKIHKFSCSLCSLQQLASHEE